MVSWSSPQDVARDSASFNNLMHALLGLYMWEWATTLEFDISFIRGKRQFKWPLTFYFLGRYCLVFALIGIAIALNVTTVEINCQALYTFNQCVGNATIGLASINLSLRTMAIWRQKWFIVIPLVAIILGHWSLLLHGILLKAAYTPGVGCTITSTKNTILAATFIYTMAFDLLVLVLSALKLSFMKDGRSKLISMLFRDGLIYFAVAFLGNLVATVFMIMNLNAVMSIIFNVPAAIVSTIAACRVVRRLAYFSDKECEVAESMNTPELSTLQQYGFPVRSNSSLIVNPVVSGEKGRTMRVPISPYTNTGHDAYASSGGGCDLHQMKTFTITEEDESPRPSAQTDEEAAPAYKHPHW